MRKYYSTYSDEDEKTKQNKEREDKIDRLFISVKKMFD